MNQFDIAGLLSAARARAPHVGALDAELLLAAVLRRSRAWLYAHARDAADATSVAQFQALWERRCAGEPYAYLVGQREFYGRPFRVTPDVLIPRADTECLLEAALACVATSAAAIVVDAGTGSGALAVSFALERPQAWVLAIDRSAAALAVAKANARALGARLSLLQCDWLTAIGDRCVDVLIANPPYLSADDPHLRGELAFEPVGALVAGPQGLEDIQTLTWQALRVLRAHGRVLFEHGSTQGAAVRAILSAAGFTEVATQPDLEGRERVSLGRRP